MAQGEPTSIGPYQVERRLGQGGMGVVYVCRHPLMPRSVAVKQTLARGANPRALERFNREAALLAKVKNPGIVTVHALGQTADGPYLVMDLVEGQALDRAVRDGPLAPKVAARIVRDLARAVAAIHAAGVIHRDIKPGNVILRADGSAVLLDFGLAREVDADRLTRTGEVVGTLLYMPPEQASGRSTAELDGRVDIYALGAVLYELLCARPPYAGGPVQVLAKILGPGEPPPPSSASSSSKSGAFPVPPEVDAIVRVAMAKDRDERYPTALSLAADLDRFLADEPPVAMEKVRRGAGRWIAAGVVVAALGGGAAFAMSRGEDVAPPAVSIPRAPERPRAVTEAPLWSIAPGEQLGYDLELHEEGGLQLIDFGCTLLLERRPDAAGAGLAFACEVTGLTCAFRVDGAEGGGVRYDSRSPDPKHPLAMLHAAVGRPFECALDPMTGAVTTLRGFDEIQDLVRVGQREGLHAIGMTDQQIDYFVRGVFNDEFIGRSMDALTRVRGEARRIPWRTHAGAEADALEFQAHPAEPLPGVLPSLTTPSDGADVFRFDGSSRYRGGRVERADMRQELVRAPQRRCVMRWSMTLQKR